MSLSAGDASLPVFSDVSISYTEVEDEGGGDDDDDDGDGGDGDGGDGDGGDGDGDGGDGDGDDGDGDGGEDSKTVVQANAGQDVILTVGDSIALDGSSSTGDGLSYSWEVISGIGHLGNATSNSPTFSMDADAEKQDVVVRSVCSWAQRVIR